jgi:hypothetical protein
MLQRLWVAVLAALLLGGCGRGSEDFTVRIARPPERVIQVLGHGELDADLREHFPGLKIERTEPAENEVLYSIPGDSSFPAAIHLTFEAVNSGTETVVHAAVDVPAAKVSLKGKGKVISEIKVEKVLRELVEKVGSKLEEGGDTAAERKDFSQLLTALAIVTDSKQLRLAIDMESNPERYMGDLDSLYDGEDGDEAAQADGDALVGDDPSAATRRQEYKEKEHAAKAAAPMDDAEADEAEGDRAAGDGTAPEE